MAANISNLTEKLVNATENSAFILISSSIGMHVKKLFDAFLHNDASTCCLFLTNTPKQLFANISSNIKLYDYFGEILTKKRSVDICEYINSVEFDNTSVFIDSLTPLLKLQNNSTVCQLLLKLKKRSRRLICVLNKDCVSELSYECVSQIASTIIETTCVTRNRFTVNIVHKKPNLKTSVSVLYSNESFNVDNDFKIKYCKLDANEMRNIANGDEALQNLPFNLNLRDDERQAKDKLVMPYMKVQGTNIGKVYYEPDKNDDIDEEDPDDDLDI